MYTHLEDYIHDLFKIMKITKPEELTIENVANKLSLTVMYKNKAYRFGDEIVLTPGTNWEQWILFCHELAHYLRHSGSQLDMHQLFIDLQEYQATYFAYHFTVPTFMLDNLKGVNTHVIMEHFNVDEEFAFRRLEMYQNRRMLVARTYR